MTVMAPPTPSTIAHPDLDPNAICSECGLPASHPAHVEQEPPQGDTPGGDEGEGPEGPTGKGNQPTEDEDDDESEGGDESDEDSDDDEDEDESKGGSGTDADDLDDDDDTNGGGGDEDDEDGEGDDEDEGDEPGGSKGKGEPKGEPKPLGKLPDELSGAGASPDGINITPQDIEALQKAVEEHKTLDGDPEHGMGQVLTDIGEAIEDNPTNLRYQRYYYQQQGDEGGIGAATASIRAAFLRSKLGVEDYEGGQRSGHLSPKDLFRVAQPNDDRFFGRRTSPDVQSFNIWVMVDCSSSMMGGSIKSAANVAQAWAVATSALSTVRTKVWGWSNAFAPNKVQQVHCSFGAVLAYRNGMPVESVQALTKVRMGGTPDAPSLAWAVKAIQKDSQHGEQPIIVMVSDGQGYDLSPVTAKAAKQGVRVIGVSISGSVQDTWLDKCYGKGNYIGWTGSVAGMAMPLARLISRIITPTSGIAR